MLLSLLQSYAATGAPNLSGRRARIRRMARLYVEGWDPGYGTPLEPDDALTPTIESIDTTVEMADDAWAPLDGNDDGWTDFAFVDGVRRIDARLTIDDPEAGPVPGICGTLAVGATLWDRAARRSEVAAVRLERLALFGGGRSEVFPEVSMSPGYRTESVADPDPDALLKHLHNQMRRAERDTAERLASEGHFVVADGPLRDLSARDTVGYIKSHRVTYLPAEHNRVISALGAGQRTPLFTTGDYARYSWYLRLAVLPGGHSWTGVVRCEASESLPLAEVRSLADRTAAVLPTVASEAHVDPRAPQNLVPIAGLERDLRHRMGDPMFVNRALRAAVRQEVA